MKQPAIDLNDVRLASERIRPWIRNTPVLSSESLDQDLGCHVHFKCENLQHIGAFKARGACNAVLNLSDHAAASGVLTHSSGNHAAALARAARIRGIEAHIVMPVNSAEVKLAAVRRLGVAPILCEPTAEAREIRAAELLKKTGATLIHPFDNPDVIAGQGTVALELLSQLNRIDAVICPVGGGGLLSGTLTVIKTLRPDVAVYAAEPEWANDCARGMKSGRIELNDRFDTIADGLRTPLGQLTFPIIHSLVDDVLLVDETSIITATQTIKRELRVVAEPSGAVPLAAIMQHRELFLGRHVAVIISGGNIDPTSPAA